MASNKNQHYVPKCYLKPFTLNRKGSAINLLNIDRRRFIDNAPVKNQCSGNYFYGKNIALENAIQHVEGAYASSLSRILKSGYVLAPLDVAVLRSFWLLQYMRTEAASRRISEMANGMVSTSGAAEEYRMSIRDAVQMSMRMFPEVIKEIEDLKICLLRNRTELPFLTGDDPAIMTNRWYLTNESTRHASIGLGRAGALFFLPLSPDVACVLYDGDVYSIPHDNGWVNVRKASDIKAVNEHQFINCRANIFFSNCSYREWILEEFVALSSNRLQSRNRITVAVLDKEDGEWMRYKVVDPVTIDEGSQALIHSQALTPKPNTWPSVISWRNRGSVYTNGTGMGYVRRSKSESYDGVRGFERVRIN